MEDLKKALEEPQKISSKCGCEYCEYYNDGDCKLKIYDQPHCYIYEEMWNLESID